MNEAQLKACPFCGATAAFQLADGENEGGEYIECTNRMCGITTSLKFGDKTDVKPLLAEIWNERAGDRESEAATKDQCVAGSLQQAGCAALCISYPLEITDNTTCVYLRDGTKITVERDATTKGRAWLKVSQQARITPAQHNDAAKRPAANNQQP